jgi:ubiquinone/menaquinone biosynthesis C-methylase UbiE
MSDRLFKHTDAHKLEDPARLTWLPPAEVVQRLALQPGMKVADIGAGTGYFSIPMGRAVGATGKVFAVDVQPEMLAMLREKLLSAETPENVSLHQGDASHVPLPDASVDLVFFANVWHELNDYPAVLQEARRILAPGGSMAIVDWRSEVPPPPGPPQDHRVSATEVAEALGTNNCQVISSSNIGQFSYLVLAVCPALRARSECK